MPARAPSPRSTGGPAATACPDRFPDADHVFLGEAEGRLGPLLEAIAAPKGHLPRILSGSTDRPDLETSPVPRFELLEKAKVQTYFVLKRYAPWSIDRLKQLRLEVLLRKINAAKNEPLKVAPEVEQALRAHYRDEVAAMREFLGRELPSWG